MTTRTVPDLKELFKQASEIAQQVPPNMQEAAFNRALDLLTGAVGRSAPAAESRPPAAAEGRSPAPKGKSQRAQVANGSPEPVSDRVGALLRTLDSTQHPAVVSASKTLDQALMVLKIALDEQSIDGLLPSDIARVLKEKFRVSVAENAVRMALSRAANLVDRVKDGAGYSYRIMAPGNNYLAALNSGDAAQARPAPSRRAKKKASVQKNTSPAPLAAGKAIAASQDKGRPAKGLAAKRAGANSLGPKAAVLALIGDGFFSSPKTGLEVQEFLKKKRGYGIGTDKLRVAMLRLVRDRQLEREINANGDYEYKGK